jgi:hypothetical protein
MLIRSAERPSMLGPADGQYLTVDIQQFSNKLAEIYSNIAKPVLDVM